MATDREQQQSIQDIYGPGAFLYNGKVYQAINDPTSMPWNTGAYGNQAGYISGLQSNMTPLSQFTVPDYVRQAMPNATGAVPLDTLNQLVNQNGIGINPPESTMDKLGLPLTLGFAGLGLSGALGAGGLFDSAGGLFGSGSENVLSGINPSSWVSPLDTFGSGSEGLSGLTSLTSDTGVGGYPMPPPSTPPAGATSLGTPMGQVSPAAVDPSWATSAGGTGGGGILDWIRQNPTAAGIAGNLIGGGLGAIGSLAAAKTQAGAANDANQAIMSMYQQNRADLEPWRQAGVGALGQLTNLTTPGKQLDTAVLDPGYQFRYGEGLKELDNRLRAAGKFYSGDALKGGQQYAQNFATGEFGNVYNRLANLAGLGQVGTTAGIAAGTNAANNVANNLTGIGNARASGYVGGFNALSGGLSNAIRGYQEQDMLARLLQGGGY